MVLSDEKKKEYMKRLLLSRMRILNGNGFYGLLLMHMIYSLDEGCETAATDGYRIYFAPGFLDEISDSELDFIMMHEVLHVVLQHCFRQGSRENDRFNVACDIVVNSNILLSENMDHSAITLKKYGESMHLTPDGKEGYEYTAEQVYYMLQQKNYNNKSYGKVTNLWDDHTRWGTFAENEVLRDVWKKNLEDAFLAVSVRDPSNQRGMLPAFAARYLKELKNSQVDWRTVLNEFIQEEICDYSFIPPDRRFEESPYYLPDFNDKEYFVANILFMIDTSGSMSDDMVTSAYSEIKGAIEQFDGKLMGWLGFFDAAVVKPEPFADEGEFHDIKPFGGAGTDYQIIFDYVLQNMQDDFPAYIIILTDGCAPFPNEAITAGIPVLWLLNNTDVQPPWGMVARMSI